MWEGTLPGSPGREMMVDMHVGYANGAQVSDETHPSAFIADLLAKLLDVAANIWAPPLPPLAVSSYYELE
jgi:hypothetical protein